MKEIKYVTDSMQLMIDSGINGFGVELAAESYGKMSEMFEGEPLLCIRRDKEKRPVYVLLSMQRPLQVVFEEEAQATKEESDAPPVDHEGAQW